MKYLETELTEKELQEYISKKGKNSLTKEQWDDISWYQVLSEEFIREHKDHINWRYVSFKQTLSEEFIIEYKEEVNWYFISFYQVLSRSFKYRYYNKIFNGGTLNRLGRMNSKDVF